MNIPTYEKKDYSYLSNAFGNLSKGIGGISTGIKNVQDVAAGERKRKEEEEKQAFLKLSREDTEEVRENLIAETALKIHKARGYSDDRQGYDQALTEALKIVYAPTLSEYENGTAIPRFLKQENTDIPDYINKINMKKFDKEYLAGNIQRPLGPRAEYTPPQGRVGVEDRGAVQQPLSAFPQSKQELQQSGIESSITNPRLFDTVSEKMTPWNAHDRAVELGIAEQPSVQTRLATIGQRSVTEKERPGKTYRGEVLREAASLPVESEQAEKFGKTYQEEMTDKEKEDLRLKELEAKNKGQAKLSDETNKTIQKQMDRQDRLMNMKLNNTTRINNLIQAREKLRISKNATPDILQLLGTEGLNVNKPNIKEIDNKIRELTLQTNTLNNEIKDTKGIINSLSGGSSLPKAIRTQGEKQTALNKDATDWIKTKIAPRYPQGTTTRVIIKETPDSYKESVQQMVDYLKGKGHSDWDVANYLLGRNKQ